MKRVLLTAVLTVGCLATAHAQENQTYQCQRNDDTRTVAVEYTMTDGSQSCSVMYKKVASSADPAKELWHYQAHLDMCATQATQFIQKLEGFGLSCSTDKTAMKE